ncbi:MAG: hypothetical protein ACI8U4_000148 [Natronomonas sp.]|jgi:hypothetical protein
MVRSARSALREGTWRRVSVGPFGLLAAAGAIGDAVTTAYIIYSPDGNEANRLIDGLASLHPAVGAVGFAAFLGAVLAVALLSFGWLSDAAAGFLVCSPGISAIHNVVGFTTGFWLLRQLPVPLALSVGVLFPVFGYLVGTAAAARKGPLPWTEVTAGFLVVAGVGLAGTAL